jgi:hypothetical protein
MILDSRESDKPENNQSGAPCPGGMNSDVMAYSPTTDSPAEKVLVTLIEGGEMKHYQFRGMSAILKDSCFMIVMPRAERWGWICSRLYPLF